ncbi:major facilitator superfamily protein [Aureococcus anophagefferens]|uniref:Major facilitator superfamily protein n=1 Tax=Aureococcus anophagefferens TaxID=44056 RepID=A0ABR1G763_AURAN
MEEVRAPLAPDAERSVRTAVIGNFVDIFGLCTILPLIPFFVKDVGAPKIWVGLISGAQFLGCCLGNFTWGQVGDRRDPNAVALGLMVGDAVFFALTACVVPGPRVAEYKAKYLGGALLGQIFGPVNGGLLGTLGWAYPCYVAAAAAAAAAARLAYVGLFGLGLCFALMLSLSFYETWERTFGVYGMLAVFGPAGVALTKALEYFASSHV